MNCVRHLRENGNERGGEPSSSLGKIRVHPPNKGGKKGLAPKITKKINSNLGSG